MKSPRVVFDCNTYLQALASPRGPAGKCFEAVVANQAVLFVSSTSLFELRDVATRPMVASKLRISPGQVDEFVEAVLSVATLIDKVPQVFVYPRDPDDAHYINLALAADARLIVSRDRDLLDLMLPDMPEGIELRARYPDFRILSPNDFVALIQT